MTEKTRKPFAERIRIELEESLAHAKGERNLKTIDYPEAPPEIDAPTLAALRKDAAMSQMAFAKMLSISTKTVQSWEQGVRIPSLAARRLIQIFALQPAALCKVVGLPTVQLGSYVVKSFPKGIRRIVRTGSAN